MLPEVFAPLNPCKPHLTSIGCWIERSRAFSRFSLVSLHVVTFVFAKASATKSVMMLQGTDDKGTSEQCGSDWNSANH
jgi:hypothetical protein